MVGEGEKEESLRPAAAAADDDTEKAITEHMIAGESFQLHKEVVRPWAKEGASGRAMGSKKERQVLSCNYCPASNCVRTCAEKSSLCSGKVG